MLGPDGTVTQNVEELCASFVALEKWIAFSQTLTYNDTNFSSDDFYECLRVAHFSKEIADTLESIGYRPLPLEKGIMPMKHQRKCFSFMKEREINHLHGIKGGMLRLETGLGKSMVAVAYALMSLRPSYPKEKNRSYPTLIVMPKTIISEWKDAFFAKFFQERVKVMYFHNAFMSSSAMKEMKAKDFLDYDFVVTNYDTISTGYKHLPEKIKERVSAVTRGYVLGHKFKGKLSLFALPWERVICDESQKFSSENTGFYKGLKNIYGEYKWCLTGTPMRNGSDDLRTQLLFLGYKEENPWSTEGLFALGLNKTLLSMSYADAGINLPLKTHSKHFVTPLKQEKVCYEAFLQEATKSLGKKDFGQTLALITTLRQICVAPCLLLSSKKIEVIQRRMKLLKKLKVDMKWLEDENSTSYKGCKVVKVCEIVESIPETDKAIVFSTFSTGINHVSKVWEERNPDKKYLVITGDTKRKGDLIEKFKTNPKIKVLFITFFVGYEGLNLTAANHVVFMDLWWTDACRHQAESRTWRIGQNKRVYVHTIISKDTIEESMGNICDKKGDYSSAILAGKKKRAIKLDRAMAEKLLKREPPKKVLRRTKSGFL